MNLHALLQAREDAGEPVGVGLIGAGKFGSMYLAQARVTPGVRIAVIADLNPDRAAAALATTGWHGGHGVRLTDDAAGLIGDPAVEVVIDATGSPTAGVAHVLACCDAKKHVVMVNVEADALAGPLLAERARAAGIVYSLAYGDQPALICELVDWARAAGFPVVAAGKGTRYRPGFHYLTPDEVWPHYGIAAEDAAKGGMNPQMFCSFLDGTKSAIEMAAVANATGLTPAPHGLSFPPCGTGELAEMLRPKHLGGVLHHAGQVEVIASEERDGRAVPGDLRWGVYVTFAAPSDYAARCFQEYGLKTDASGRVAAMWKPFHLIGLELGISVASVALRGEPTGAPDALRADVVATAKRDLAAGETLDGEGGTTVHGKLMRADDSLALGGLPIGLAHDVRLTGAVARNAPVRWADVEISDSPAVRLRRELEAGAAALAAE